MLESDYNIGGILLERPSNARRNESTGCQLARMQYSPGMGGSSIADEDLEENICEIYLDKVLQWKLPIDAEMQSMMAKMFVPEYLHEMRPEIFPQPPVNNICA